MTTQEVLDRLLRFEGLTRSVSFDGDRVSGGSTSSPPPGTRLQDSPGRMYDSPYHYFAWMIEHAEDEREAMRLTHLAEELLYQLEHPHDIPHIDLESLEIRICEYGQGLTNEQIAQWTGLSALQVGEIRKANDLDDKGEYVTSVAWLKIMAQRLFDEGKTYAEVSVAVGRSERRLRDWRKEFAQEAETVA